MGSNKRPSPAVQESVRAPDVPVDPDIGKRQETDRSFQKPSQSDPWNDVYGLRNRIVHDYGMADLHIVYSTLAKDIPELLNNLET